MANIFNKWVDNRIEKVLDAKNLNVSEGMNIMMDEDYLMRQNKAFYMADTPELLRFFATNRPKNQIGTNNLFYRVVNGNIPVLHYPLANIITKTMVNLLFNHNPIIEVKSKSKKRSKELTDKLDNILEENNFSELLQKAAEYESYSGAVAFKPILDSEFSDNPILMIYPKEDVDVVKKYDRITEIIFKDYYEVEKDRYVLYTICGMGYIDYALYKINSGNKLKEVSLATLPETAELKRLNFYNNDGTPYNKLMAVYKENKADGRSDYYNLTDDFAAIDEIYSNMINFIRKSKIKTYLPENTLKFDVNGGRKIIPNDYDTDNIILYDSNPEGTKQDVVRDTIDINASIQGYKDAFNNVLLNALSTAGLSPCSVGLDMAGANSSGLALNIRERVSLRTRSEKIKRWKASLEQLSALLLSLSDFTSAQEGLFINEMDEPIEVSFQEYESPTYSEQVTVLSDALNNNLIDLESALKLLYPDKEDKEIELMMIAIEGQLPDEEDIVNEELNNNEKDPEMDENN